MPTIVNDPAAASHPVAITGSIDSAGALRLEFLGEELGDEDQLYIKHLRLSETSPVVVPITVSAPAGWTLSVSHLDDGTAVAWPSSSTGECQLTWAETDGETSVSIIVTPPSSTGGAEREKTIFIKVGPDPELPV